MVQVGNGGGLARNEKNRKIVYASYSRRFIKRIINLRKSTKKKNNNHEDYQGAGHMVPTDRPGPALQMIDNFLKQKDYDTPVPYSMDRKPLLHQYRVSCCVEMNNVLPILHVDDSILSCTRVTY